MDREVELQRAYYTATAPDYDTLHAHETPPLALAFMGSAIELLGATTVLDVGSGTGRVVRYLAEKYPNVRAVGIEPVEALRLAGHKAGIPLSALIDGDATKLPFEDGSIDVVCALSVLHHIREPHLAVSEMLRVARCAIFICDSNNFAQGRLAPIKRLLRAAGLWPVANWLKTGGRGYIESKGDGISYSYSVFNNYGEIRKQCNAVHLMNLDGDGKSMYKKATTVALLGIKRGRRISDASAR
jgi:ubiquinone/menaquinone biosynthesis C-methylase UbiE